MDLVKWFGQMEITIKENFVMVNVMERAKELTKMGVLM
jgi:cell fate (sporulation/competence/biofilm development) regulator YmcA (YheA/YmcA/DUF963 family)